MRGWSPDDVTGMTYANVLKEVSRMKKIISIPTDIKLHLNIVLDIAFHSIIHFQTAVGSIVQGKSTRNTSSPLVFPGSVEPEPPLVVVLGYV
jgi:hypothetical protein